MSDSLGERMKEYESASKHRLTPKVPVIGRIDGKCFSRLTQNLKRPFDTGFHECMVDATLAVTKAVSGCQVGYTQSDEISILLTDYEKETTQPYFDYKIEKLASVVASTATAAFLISFLKYFPERRDTLMSGNGLPAFDARFFNLPKEEVNNYFIWRQQDATRNSIQMLARSQFSHKECFKKSCPELKEMLLTKNIGWDDQPNWFRYGTVIHKKNYRTDISLPKEKETINVSRSKWEEDLVPLFVEDPSFIVQKVYSGIYDVVG